MSRQASQERVDVTGLYDRYMKPLLTRLDERTLAALNRVAAPEKRQRSEFVRQAIRKAIPESKRDF
jgi:metal-responsive CopG/Arc/MetJ family transcriptional regulator